MPTDANLWARFMAIATLLPSHPALIQGNRVWNFARLRASANAFAYRLNQAGIGEGARVLVWANNSPELAAALLGIWAVGGIPVFVHAEAPVAHLFHAAKTSGATLCIGDKTRPDPSAGLNCPLWEVEELEKVLPEESDTTRFSGPALATLPASILFTSGSTGLPKGVVQSHHNLMVGCETVYSYLGYSGSDRIVCPIPWTFDYGYGQLLTTICFGLTQILPESPNPFGLCAAIEAHRPTVLPGIPSWFTYLFRGVSPLSQTDTSSIRIVTNTGGTIPPGVLEDMLSTFSHAKIFLNYGLTESYRSTFLDPALVATHRSSIGRPMPGVDIAIVRDDGSIASAGEGGEIVHRGNCIFLGYWGDPEATAKVLRPDPLLPPDAGRFVKALFTGDIGHKDEQGFIYYKSRRDHQIKSMGVRVSPGEIEAILHDSGLVRNVAVFALPHEMIGEAVMAAFEPLAEDSDVISKLHQYARKTMNAHMHPREYFTFERLPKTPSGKTDYVAIKKLCSETSKFVR